MIGSDKCLKGGGKVRETQWVLESGGQELQVVEGVVQVEVTAKSDPGSLLLLEVKPRDGWQVLSIAVEGTE